MVGVWFTSRRNSQNKTDERYFNQSKYVSDFVDF